MFAKIDKGKGDMYPIQLINRHHPSIYRTSEPNPLYIYKLATAVISLLIIS